MNDSGLFFLKKKMLKKNRISLKETLRILEQKEK